MMKEKHHNKIQQRKIKLKNQVKMRVSKNLMSRHKVKLSKMIKLIKIQNKQLRKIALKHKMLMFHLRTNLKQIIKALKMTQKKNLLN